MEGTVDTWETRGVIRKVDKLGRIVIPKEFRNTLNLKVEDDAEIYLLKDGIYIKKV